MNPLTELIPAVYRKYVYAVAATAVFLYGLYEASEGDIKTLVVSVLAALVSATAASNTTVNELVDEATADPYTDEVVIDVSGAQSYLDDEDEDTFVDGHGAV